MKIENQVCTLEQAKILDDLEIEQESLFRYSLIIENEDYAYKLGYWNENGNASESYSAFTVAELGCMLLDKCNNISNINAADNWRIDFEHRTQTSPEKNYGTGTTQFKVWCKTEAHARAALLIYILENNLITTEEINQRKFRIKLKS